MGGQTGFGSKIELILVSESADNPYFIVMGLMAILKVKHMLNLN